MANMTDYIRGREGLLGLLADLDMHKADPYLKRAKVDPYSVLEDLAASTEQPMSWRVNNDALQKVVEDYAKQKGISSLADLAMQSQQEMQDNLYAGNDKSLLAEAGQYKDDPVAQEYVRANARLADLQNPVKLQEQYAAAIPERVRGLMTDDKGMPITQAMAAADAMKNKQMMEKQALQEATRKQSMGMPLNSDEQGAIFNPDLAVQSTHMQGIADKIAARKPDEPEFITDENGETVALQGKNLHMLKPPTTKADAVTKDASTFLVSKGFDMNNPAGLKDAYAWLATPDGNKEWFKYNERMSDAKFNYAPQFMMPGNIGPNGEALAMDARSGRVMTVPGVGKPLSDTDEMRLKDQKTIADSLDRLTSSYRDGFGGGIAGTGIGGNIKTVAELKGWKGDKKGAGQWWQDYRYHENQVRNKMFGQSLTAGEQRSWEGANITRDMTDKQIKQNMLRRREIEQIGLERMRQSAVLGGGSASQVKALTGGDAPSGIAAKQGESGKILVGGKIYTPDKDGFVTIGGQRYKARKKNGN